MNRRSLLRLLAMGVIGHQLDIDKLLWVPGAKKIFLPPIRGMSLDNVLRIEMERLQNVIPSLFMREDFLYQKLTVDLMKVSGKRQ